MYVNIVFSSNVSIQQKNTDNLIRTIQVKQKNYSKQPRSHPKIWNEWKLKILEATLEILLPLLNWWQTGDCFNAIRLKK